MLRLAIPRGSLEEKNFKLFEMAGLPIKGKRGRDYSYYIDDPRISEVFMLRSQEVAKYVSLGEFDFGTSGEDWPIETRSRVKKVANLEFSRNGWNKVRLILGTNTENPITDVSKIKIGARIITEYCYITKRYFQSLEREDVKIIFSFGATEIKVPRLADYFVDIVDSGETLVKNNKKILATIMESSTFLVANINSMKDPQKRQAIEEIAELLMRVVRARDKTLLKFNVAKSNLETILDYLPAAKAPSVIPLAKESWFSVETMLNKSEMNVILPKVKSMGAINAIETDADKYSP